MYYIATLVPFIDFHCREYILYRWLVKKHRDEKASRVLVRLRRSSPEEVKPELEEIQASIKDSEMGGARAWWWAWRALLRWRIIQRCGVLFIIFYNFHDWFIIDLNLTEFSLVLEFKYFSN